MKRISQVLFFLSASLSGPLFAAGPDEECIKKLRQGLDEVRHRVPDGPHALRSAKLLSFIPLTPGDLGPRLHRGEDGQVYVATLEKDTRTLTVVNVTGSPLLKYTADPGAKVNSFNWFVDPHGQVKIMAGDERGKLQVFNMKNSEGEAFEPAGASPLISPPMMSDLFTPSRGEPWLIQRIAGAERVRIMPVGSRDTFLEVDLGQTVTTTLPFEAAGGRLLLAVSGEDTLKVFEFTNANPVFEARSATGWVNMVWIVGSHDPLLAAVSGDHTLQIFSPDRGSSPLDTRKLSAASGFSLQSVGGPPDHSIILVQSEGATASELFTVRHGRFERLSTSARDTSKEFLLSDRGGRSFLVSVESGPTGDRLNLADPATPSATYSSLPFPGTGGPLGFDALETHDGRVLLAVQNLNGISIFELRESPSAFP